MRKNKLIKLISFTLIFATVPNCAPIATNKGLSFRVFQQSVSLSNSIDDTCASTNATFPAAPDKAIKAVSFRIPKMTIDWTGAAPLTITKIKINLTSGSLSAPYVCELSGADLLATWISLHGRVDTSGLGMGCGTAFESVKTDLIITPGVTTAVPTTAASICSNTVYTSNSCPIKCGGIKFYNNNASASGGVEIQVDGYYAVGDGTFPSVSLKKYMTFTYSP